LESYNKALKIYRQVFVVNHPDVALSIWEKYRPANHPDLNVSHGNIGYVYKQLGDYNFYLEPRIYKKSLPSQHPSIGLTLKDTGLVYQDKGNFQQAQSYFAKAATVYQHSLALTHPNVIKMKENIQRICSNKIKEMDWCFINELQRCRDCQWII
jgi:tetratricopeptide (TPR) repeat protein